MIKVIRTRVEYDATLAAIEALMDRHPIPGSAEADRLEVLSLLVEDYEKKNENAWTRTQKETRGVAFGP